MIFVGCHRVDKMGSEAGLGHLEVGGVVTGVFRDEFCDVVVEGVGEVRIVAIGREVDGRDERSVRHGRFGRSSY